MRIETDRLVVVADEHGRLVDVAPQRAVDRAFLSDVGVGACRVDGRDASWQTQDVAVDSDEIAVRLTGGLVDLELRHAFSAGWTTRLLLVNPSTETRRVERLQLSVRPAGAQRASALTAGARLCVAIQPADGTGPVLTVRLASGAVTRVDNEGFELGPLRLAPGQRYVTQFRWELLATPRSVVAGPGRDVLVARTVYELDEAVLLPDDPDAALVLPRGVAADVVEEPDGAGQEVFAYEPGRHLVEIRSAEGDVRLDLTWVPPLTVALGQRAGALLAGPRTPAGVVALDDLAAAVVLQAALAIGVSEDAEQAGDALDRLTARLLDGTRRPADDPLGPFFLLGEHNRSGDPDVRVAALDGLAELLVTPGIPPPGLGLALLRSVLAAANGSDERAVELVARALARIDGAADPRTDPSPEADRGVDREAATAADLELLLAVQPLLPPEHPAQRRVAPLVRRLGALLGSGLPGRLLDPPPVAEQAHLVAVLRMLPEDGFPAVTRGWAAPPTLLAHRVTLEVLDRLGEPPDQDVRALAWLAVVQRDV